MKPSEEQFRQLAFEYTHQIFRNAPFKTDTMMLMAEAGTKIRMFSNTGRTKPSHNPEVPLNELSREQLAVGLALSMRISSDD